jgi:hypothetical protein
MAWGARNLISTRPQTRHGVEAPTATKASQFATSDKAPQHAHRLFVRRGGAHRFLWFGHAFLWQSTLQYATLLHFEHRSTRRQACSQ